MKSLLLSIGPQDPLWIAIAFALGLATTKLGLPPLVGFLFAGYVLNYSGAEAGEFLNATADLGITLLLFTIGLKLDLRSLIRPHIWGVSLLHMASVSLLFAAAIIGFGALGVPLFDTLPPATALLIGFALSFSSTVFTVKILDSTGRTASRAAAVAIGILIMQDVAAVAYLAASTGKLPTPYALGLLLLIPMRKLLWRILDNTGHGELLVLFGLAAALSGADLFELVGMKGDLGALILGMLLAGSSKANELSKALMGFKEIFLIGFFLLVGMTALPDWHTLLAAMLLLPLLFGKVILYFLWLSLFKLRSSTAATASINLASFSEFGLIVGALAISTGQLPADWVAVIAILVSLSFLFASPLNKNANELYMALRPRLKRFERNDLLNAEQPRKFDDVHYLVFGMGRVGSATYTALDQQHPGHVVGVDVDQQRVASFQEQKLRVIHGDASNPDFWTLHAGIAKQVDLVILTLPYHQASIQAAKQLRCQDYLGPIVATSRFPDEADELLNNGVDHAFNLYAAAGHGFVSDLQERFIQSIPKKPSADKTHPLAPIPCPDKESE